MCSPHLISESRSLSRISRQEVPPTRFPGSKEKHSFAPHLFWWCPAPPSGSSPPLLEPCSLLEVLLPSSLPLAVPHQLCGVSETKQRDCWLYGDKWRCNLPKKTIQMLQLWERILLGCCPASVHLSVSSRWPQRTSVHPSTPNSRYRCHEHTTVPPSQTPSSIIHVWQFTSRTIRVTHSPPLETQCPHWQTSTLLFWICWVFYVLRLFLMILTKYHWLNHQNESTNTPLSSSGLGWLDMTTQARDRDHLKKPKLVARVTTDRCSCPPPPDSSPLTSDGCCALEPPAGWLAASAAAYGRHPPPTHITSASRGEKCH